MFQLNSGYYWSSSLSYSRLQIRTYSYNVELYTDTLWLPKRSPTIREVNETEHAHTPRSKNQKEALATSIRIQQPQEYQITDSITT